MPSFLLSDPASSGGSPAMDCLCLSSTKTPAVFGNSFCTAATPPGERGIYFALIRGRASLQPCCWQLGALVPIRVTVGVQLQALFTACQGEPFLLSSRAPELVGSGVCELTRVQLMPYIQCVPAGPLCSVTVPAPCFSPWKSCEHWGEGAGRRLQVVLVVFSLMLHVWCDREEGAAKGPALLTYFTRVFLCLLQAASSSPHPVPQSVCKLFLWLQWPEEGLGQRGSGITGGTKVVVILKMPL